MYRNGFIESFCEGGGELEVLKAAGVRRMHVYKLKVNIAADNCFNSIGCVFAFCCLCSTK